MNADKDDYLPLARHLRTSERWQLSAAVEASDFFDRVVIVLFVERHYWPEDAEVTWSFEGTRTNWRGKRRGIGTIQLPKDEVDRLVKLLKPTLYAAFAPTDDNTSYPAGES